MVKSSEPMPAINGHDKEQSGQARVRFLKKVDPYLLADPFVVSG